MKEIKDQNPIEFDLLVKEITKNISEIYKQKLLEEKELFK